MSKRAILVVAAILALALVISLGFYLQKNTPGQPTSTATETETSSGPVLNLGKDQLSDEELSNLRDNLSQLLGQIKGLSQIQIPNKPANLQLTRWTKSLVEEIGSEISKNPLTATYTSYSPKDLMSMMGRETDIEKRIAILAVYYYKTASSTLQWGEAFTITPDSQNPVDALGAILRARSMLLTLKDAESILSQTSTQSMLEKLLPMAEKWEKEYRSQMDILREPKLPAIADIVAAYYPLTPLMSAPQSTASQILNTLSATSGMTATTMGKPDVLFLIYSAEHTRVAAEALSKINSLTQRNQPAPDLEEAMSKAWDEIQNALKISLPEEPTSTTAKEALNKLSQDLTQKYNFDKRDIGAFMINMLLDDWRIYKTEKDLLRRLAATAEAKGILSILTEEDKDVKSALNRTFPVPKDPKTGFDLEDSSLVAIAKLNLYLARHISGDSPLKSEMLATSRDATEYASMIAPQLDELLAKLNKDNYTTVYSEFSEKLNNILKVLLIPTMNLQTGMGIGYILP